jgi:hypothetical protein
MTSEPSPRWARWLVGALLVLVTLFLILLVAIVVLLSTVNDNFF